ncbi:MAG: histidine kinase N-terminal 7TM domain-containing protein [Sporomusaceae bacterium]|nr:histidine kinase N-terminal 7TM domain-containing protein [Sporomusaceae bacterium]
MRLFTADGGGSPRDLLIYHPINDIWLYLLAAAVLLALGVYTWRYRKSPPAMCLALSTGARVVWLVALVMITVSPAPADKFLWAVIHQMGAMAVIPLALMTALYLTGQRPAVIRAASTLLLALTGFFGLAVLTSGWHDWYWRAFPWGGATFGFVRGPLFWATMAIAYLSLAASLALYIHRAASTSGLRRWQALAVPADTVISAAGHILWVTGASTSFALPVAFMLGGLVWFAIFFGLRVFNMQELAEASVTRDMNDCLIVTDAQDYIVELNPAAETLLGERAAMAGERATAAFAPWPALAALAESGEARTGEITVAGAYYLFRVSLLTGWGGRSIGKAIVLQDIGELKRAQKRILDQEKALSIMTERDRLRRELHDGPGQVWGYLKLQYQQVRELVAGERLAEADARLEKLIGLSDDFDRGVRESLAGLKAASRKGFAATLGEFMQWYEDTYGIAARLTVDPETADRLSPAAELQLLRIIQEAMANTRKHASASQVKVSLRAAGGEAAVVIEDDGCGFAAEAALAAGENRHGLGIMRERAGEIGGRLEIESAPGAGTRVTVWLPPGQGGAQG